MADKRAEAAETRSLRNLTGYTRLDKKRNTEICEKLQIDNTARRHYLDTKRRVGDDRWLKMRRSQQENNKIHGDTRKGIFKCAPGQGLIKLPSL